MFVFFFTGINENTTITMNSRLLNVFDVLLQLFVFFKKKKKKKILNFFQRYLFDLTLNVMQKVEIPCLPNKIKGKKKNAYLYPARIEY